MRYLKTQNLFKESVNNNIDIYQYTNYLKGYGKSNKIPELTDIFIGEGIYDRVLDMTKSMVSTLSDLDIDGVREIFNDIFDERPFYNFNTMVYECIASKNWDRDVYSGVYIFNRGLDIEKIVNYILLDIISPTMRFRESGSDEQIYVTDPIWNCVNFDVDNYDWRGGSYFSDQVKEYNVEKFFSLYSPGIYISVTDESNKIGFSYRQIESKIDDILPILENIVDVKEVVWEIPREGRMFNEDGISYDYSLKLIL
jgi:hypothetical protein